MAQLPMILTIILYAAALLFLIGMVIRIVRMAAMPVHVRWELCPVPEGAAAKARIMASEIFLLKGVFQHNRSLWLWSWLFHASIYMLIGVAGMAAAAAIFEQAKEILANLIAIFSFAAFACGLAGTAGLLIRRLRDPGLRLFTSFAAIFNLIILFGIFSSGMAHALLQPSAGRALVEQTGSLLRLNPAPDLHPASITHLCLIAFFAAYFPLTQMAHAALKYFTYHSVRWDDVPSGQMPGHSMSRYLAYPVRWLAPHIRQGMRESTWSEAVRSSSAGNLEDSKTQSRTSSL
jgi:nitrate reductase gamma subunit